MSVEAPGVGAGYKRMLRREIVATASMDDAVLCDRGFDLDIWELDNEVRGAEDIDLEPLEEAACKIAIFEEQTTIRVSNQSMSRVCVTAPHTTFRSLRANRETSLRRLQRALRSSRRRG